MWKVKAILWAILFLPLSGFGQLNSGAVSDWGGILTFWNPSLALDQEKGINVSLAEIQSSFYNSAFSLDDILSSSDGRNVISFRQVVDQLSDKNRGIVETNIHTVGLQWRQEKFAVGIGHRIRYIGDASYTDELIRLMSFGNGAFIGEEIEVGPGFSYAHYHELYLSAATQWRGLSLGARIKVLAGSEYMGTSGSKISLTTEEDYYALSFSNNYSIESSGIFSYNGLNDVSLDFDPLRLQKMFTGNRGLAFDVGIALDIGDNSKLMLSYTDIGSIQWDLNTRRYVSEGDFVYEGIDILDYVADNGSVVIADSLYQLLQFGETRDSEFDTTVPSQWSLGFKSSFGNKDMMTAIISGRSINSRTLISGLLGYNKKVSDTFSASLTYAIYGKSFDNIGATAFFDFDIFRFYFGVENIVNTFNALGTRYGGFHMGFNLKL